MTSAQAVTFLKTAATFDMSVFFKQLAISQAEMQKQADEHYLQMQERLNTAAEKRLNKSQQAAEKRLNLLQKASDARTNDVIRQIRNANYSNYDTSDNSVGFFDSD